MQLGIAIGAARPADDYGSLIRQVVEAEKEGFESIWFNSGLAGEPLTTIAVAGRETSRIRFGTGIVVTYTRHPAVMAQQALTANAATGGRLILGIGPSHRPNIERLGFSYDRAGVHTREYVSILRSLVHEGRVAHHGEFFDVETEVQAAWGEPFPILVAALAPLMLRTAGEIADGTVTWMVGPKTLREHIVPRISQAASVEGRPAPRVVVGLPVAVCDDAAEGRGRADEALGRYGGLPNYKRVLDIEGATPGEVSVCGPEADVERQLRAIAAAGATDFYASPYVVGPDPAASIRRTRALLAGLVGKV